MVYARVVMSVPVRFTDYSNLKINNVGPLMILIIRSN